MNKKNQNLVLHRAVSLTITHTYARARYDSVTFTMRLLLEYSCENYKIIREQIIIYCNKIILQKQVDCAWFATEILRAPIQVMAAITSARELMMQRSEKIISSRVYDRNNWRFT